MADRNEDPKSAKKAAERTKLADPTWPVLDQGSHAVSEFNADRQGALSPFGELSFPIDPDDLPYIHPSTVINR